MKRDPAVEPIVKAVDRRPYISLEYLAHASVILRSGEFSLLTDPWLVGTKYYGSWHHFPSAVYRDEALKCVKYIYVSHQHQDHFDPKSLRLVNREATVLIPKLHHRRFLQRVKGIGFSRIKELANHRWQDLGEGVRGCCLITGEDSALLLKIGHQHFLDSNDCNIQLHLPWLEKIKIDIMLSTFTVAYAFPFCCTFEEGRDISGCDSERACLERLLAMIRRLRPRIFIPFAGQFAFLRQAEFTMNYMHNIPPDVEAAVSRESLTGTKVVLLNPGDELRPDGTVYRSTDFTWEERDQYLMKIVQQAGREGLTSDSPYADFSADSGYWVDQFEKMLIQKMKANPVAAKWSGLRIIFSFSETIEFDPLNPLEGVEYPILCDLAGGLAVRVSYSELPMDFDLIINIPFSLLPEVLKDQTPWDTLCISCRFRLFFRKHISYMDPRIEALGIVLDTPLKRSWADGAIQRLSFRYLDALLTRRQEYWTRLKYKFRLYCPRFLGRRVVV